MLHVHFIEYIKYIILNLLFIEYPRDVSNILQIASLESTGCLPLRSL